MPTKNKAVGPSFNACSPKGRDYPIYFEFCKAYFSWNGL